MTYFQFKRAAFLAVVGGLGVSFTGGANAQQSQTAPNMPRGSMYHDVRRDPNTVDPMRPDQDTPDTMARYTHMLDWAKCATRTVGKRVDDALDAAPNGAAELTRMNRINAGGCPSRTTNILSLERGALSEAVYKKIAPATFHGDQITATSQDSSAFLDSEKDWNTLRIAGDQTMIDATNCLVAVQPALADAVIQTKHGSSDESSAMDALFAKASDCAGPMRPANLSRSFLRAFIADSLYRLAISKWGGKFVPGVSQG